MPKIVVPIVLVLAVAGSLWFAAPVADTAVAANNQGIVYYNQGEYHKAIVAFTKAIELDPSLALAFNNRGRAYAELEQYEQAIDDFDKAMQLDPNLQK